MAMNDFMILEQNENSGSKLLMRIRPSTRASVEESVAEKARYSGLPVGAE
jgi:hypothetical protein